MSAVRRIAKNTIILIVAQVVAAAFGLVYGIYAARHLGPESFGILTFAIALASLSTMLFGAGLGPLILREVSAERSAAPRYLANAGLLRVGMAAVSILAIGLYAYLMGYPSETVLVVFLLALALAFTAVADIAYSMFRAFEMMQYIAVGQIMASALLLIGVAIALVFDLNVVGFAWLYVAANGITLAYAMAVVIWRFLSSERQPLIPREGLRIELSAMRRMQAAAVPFAMVTVGTASLHYADSVMLSAMVDNANAMVGWYNAAYRLVDVLAALRAASAVSVTPALVQAYISSRHLLTFMSGRLFKYYLIMALPVGVGTTILAERFVLFLYGPDYLESTIALQILIWAFVLNTSNFVMILFQAIKRVRTVATVIVCGAILNVLLNIWLIPRFTYVAAAATTTGAGAAILVVSLALYSKTEYYSGPYDFLRLLVRLASALAAMSAFIWLLPHWHLAVVIPLAALVYFVVLVLMRTFDAGDLALLASLVSGRPVSSVTPEENEDHSGL